MDEVLGAALAALAMIARFAWRMVVRTVWRTLCQVVVASLLWLVWPKLRKAKAEEAGEPSPNASPASAVGPGHRPETPVDMVDRREHLVDADAGPTRTEAPAVRAIKSNSAAAAAGFVARWPDAGGM